MLLKVCSWNVVDVYEVARVLSSVRPLSGRDYSLSVVSAYTKYQQKYLIFWCIKMLCCTMGVLMERGVCVCVCVCVCASVCVCVCACVEDQISTPTPNPRFP